MESSIIKNYPSSLSYQIKSFEKVPVHIFNNADDGSKHVAYKIAEAIRENNRLGKETVLGLATGSSPIKVYSELIQIHQNEGLSFERVITFNLDEYFELKPDHPQSYHKFMKEYLFDSIDILPQNIHIPRGDIKLEEVEKHCKEFEEKIERVGGIDIQLLGIGRTGHIGFNEPGSEITSQTRLVRLDNLTRTDAAADFGGIEYVPYKAITMGIQTILSSKEIHILAWGTHKADIVRQAVESNPSFHVPATFLQEHDNVRYYIDTATAQRLTRVEYPWKVGNCHWDEDLQSRAVTWLSQVTKKPILKLTDEDYNQHGLSELLLKVSNAYSLNIKIFNHYQHTITGWPGGKPNTDDSNRPERAEPSKKRVAIFSPHPDDDVISMGGTFMRLVDQGHEVHAVYQTSGNIAVHPHDTLKYLEFYDEFDVQSKSEDDKSQFEKIKNYLKRGDRSLENESIRMINSLIRKGEARAAARYCGAPDDQIHFLDLPFYETGGIRKKDMSDKDIEITVQILERIKPHQIFAAGDLADPHGTHRICLNITLAALDRLKGQPWLNNCWLWLYRGAWQDYGIEEIEMAVPISPDELLRKRKAIFMHQSQKDSAPFPGADPREFWQRSEERNRNTADIYRRLGFAEYEAMEAFQRWHF